MKLTAMHPNQTDSNPETTKNGASDKPVIRSEELFGRHREILIQHNDQTYQLKITRQEKLILTK